MKNFDKNILLNFSDAVNLIDENIGAKNIVSLPLEKCAGFILAEKIKTTIDIPAFTNSAMDGFAVIADDLKHPPVKLEVIETIAAGAQPTTCPERKAARGKNVVCGKCAAIMTGAPLPAGADAVVKVEETKREGNFVEIFSTVSKGENIRFNGEEAKAGDTLVEEKTIVSPAVVGLASSLGNTNLKIFAPPRVALIITGDEVLPPGSAFQKGKIIDATGPALKSALSFDNFTVSFFEYAKDDPKEIKEKIKTALENADVVLIAGGASMGEFDFVQRALEKNNVENIFWKVAVKPGKPIWFGKKNEKLVFNLPGNPVSVIVTYYLYVRFALRRKIGFDFESAMLKKTRAKLKKTITKTDPRLEFVRGLLDKNNSVLPLRQRGSAMLSGMANANCLINFPRNCEKIPAGENVEILILPNIILVQNRI